MSKNPNNGPKKNRYTPKKGWQTKPPSITALPLQKPANKSQEESESESKTNQPANDWVGVFKEAFSVLHKNSWIQNIVVGTAYLLIALGLAILVTGKQAGVIVLAAGLTIVFWIFIVAIVIQLGKKPVAVIPDPPQVVTSTPSPAPTATPTQSVSPTISEKFLVPSNEPTPQTRQKLPQGVTTVFLGNTVVLTNQLPFAVLRQKGEDMFTIGTYRGELWFSAKFFSQDGKIVCKIVKNRFYLNRNNMSRMEETPHTLKIFNDEARLVVDVNFINPTCIRVLGKFYLRDKLPFDIQENSQQLGGPFRVSEGFFGTLGIKNSAGMAFD